MTEKETELLTEIEALGAGTDPRPIYPGEGWTAFENANEPMAPAKHHFPNLEAVLEWLKDGNECYFAFACDWTIVKGNL